MRWHLGKIPPAPDFEPEREGWRPMREPSERTFKILASLLALPLMAFWAVLWMVLNGRYGMTVTLYFNGLQGAGGEGAVRSHRSPSGRGREV